MRSTAEQEIEREDQRLEALSACNVLDTPPEESFDRITRLACRVMDAPIALITFVDGARQWFKSRQGIALRETPRQDSFCVHALAATAPLHISDARRDPRFKLNPLVTGEPKIRFYFALPLRTPDGFVLGALCVIDRRPRTASKAQIDAMNDLADLVMDQLKLRQMATTDDLTGALTRREFAVRADQVFETAKRYGRPFSCLLLDVDHFQPEGGGADRVLSVIGEACRQVLRNVDLLGRMSAAELAAALPETDLENAPRAAERLRAAIGESMRKMNPNRPLDVTASIGVATLDTHTADFAALLSRADQAMSRAKAAGRNRVVVAGAGLDFYEVSRP